MFGSTARADDVTVNEQPLDGWDTNGTVKAVKIIGSTAYIGGEFSQVRAPDGSTQARRNLAAIDMATGNVTSFAADTNGEVRTIEGDSVDLWIGGVFTTVEGLTRNRLAVLDTATGAVRNNRSPGMSGAVNSLRMSGSFMYVGGLFGSIAGVPYDRIARLSLVDGTPDATWDVSANAVVRAIAIPSSGDVVYIAGNFTQINGDAHSYLVGVSAATGAVVTPQFENLAYRAIALDVTPSGDRVMAGLSDLGNRIAVWNPATGAESWRTQVMGDVQAVKYHQGNVYFGFHDGYRGNSFIKILSADVYTGAIEPWRPAIPSFWGVWAIDASSTHGLAVGGQFTEVEGIPTRNVAIFRPLAQPDSIPPSPPQNLQVTGVTETQVFLAWDAATDNFGVTAYTVWRDGEPVGVTVDPLFEDAGNLPGQEFAYFVTAGDNAANESAPSQTVIAATNDGFVSVGATWKYLDDGSDQGTAWRQVGFDDGAWAAGPAELGFGDGREATELAGGAITYYFRRDFFLGEAPSTDATMGVRRDDGVVVYINGIEVWRDNLPGGTITAATTALSAVTGADEEVFHGSTVPAGVFRAGANEIAVEVHQVGAGSSDLAFDMALWGDASVDIDPPTVPTGLTAIDVSETTIDLTWNESSDDTAVIKYVVRRNGVVVGNVPVPGFRDMALTPDTAYAYTVEAEDAAGNRSGQSPVLNQRTDPDTTAPTSPVPLEVIATTESSVALSWGTATDNIAVTGYTVRRDGGAVTTTTGTAYTDRNLDPDTTYRYEVVAFDAAGNRSVPAGPRNARTDPARQLCDGEVVTLAGTPGNDVLEGTPGRDVIHGFGGDDVIRGLDGNDVICGGDGDDTLLGGRGRDVIRGGPGNDVLKGQRGSDTLRGNSGRDRLIGGRADDVIAGGKGTDEAGFQDLSAAVVVDLKAGTATGQGADVLVNIERIVGSSEDDVLRGDSGNNRLIGRGGADQLFGGGGNDKLLGKKGPDLLRGDGGDDVLKGAQGADELHGGAGFDVLRGGSGADICTGGEDVAGC